MSERESRSKRQRTSDVDYRERKRSKREEKQASSELDDEEPISSVQNDCRKLFQTIKELEDPEDGHLCSDLFLQPPSRRQYPDYYELIKNPIALNNMKTKIDKDQYSSVDQFKADVELMVSNAKKYNVKESYAYQDAIKILKLIKGKTIGSKSVKTDEKPVPEAQPEQINKSATIKLPALAFGNKQATPAPPVPAQDQKIKSIRLKTSVKPTKPAHTIEELMDAIGEKDTKLALDILESGSQLDVNELVSVDMFNDTFTWAPLHAAAYYGESKVVKALMAQGAKVEVHDTWYSGTPLAWAAFGDRDRVARLLVEKYNANKKAKNDHAQIPLDLVSDRDDPRWAGVLTSSPLISKAEANVPEIHQPQPIIRRSSELTSSMPTPPPAAPIVRHDVSPAPPHYIPMHDGGSGADPFALVRDVLKNVRNHTDQYGRFYSTIFEDLPDRDPYPEYFNFITNPLSLQMIDHRMMSRFYPTLQAWEADMTQIFQNAMAFAENSSRVHKDAKLLHRLYFRMKERFLNKHKIDRAQEQQLMTAPLPPWHGEPLPPRAHDKGDALDKATVDAAFGTANMRNSIKNKRFAETDNMSTYSAPRPTPSYAPPRPPLASLQMSQPSMPSYSDMPYGVPAYNKPSPPTFRPMSSYGPGAPPPMMTPDMGLAHTPPQPMAAATIPFQSPPPPPVQQLQQMQAQHAMLSPEVAQLFETTEKRKAVRLLQELQIESDDKRFAKQVDGHDFAHSILIGSNVQTLVIKTDLLEPLKQQTGRIVVQAAYNHRRLQPSEDPSVWVATPLAHGLNVLSFTVTVDVTPSSSPLAAQDIEAQTYVLFITRSPA